MLKTKDCIEIILFCGRGCSHRNIAAEFNRKYCRQQSVSHSTVGRLFNKFKATRSVEDAPRSGRPSTSEEVEMILAQIAANPQKIKTSNKPGVPRTTIQRILKRHMFHPYKLQVDPSTCLKMIQIVVWECAIAGFGKNKRRPGVPINSHVLRWKRISM